MKIENYFSSEMKMAELITRNHFLVLMLPRFGVPLGFGDKSVAEVCERFGVPTSFFLLICNVYTFDDYEPDIEAITPEEISAIVPYLSASHKYYVGERLPHLQKHLHTIAGELGGGCGAALETFFAEYMNDVAEHCAYEEKNAFPYFESLMNGVLPEDFRIKTYADTHSNIEDKLDDLMQIVFKYFPEKVLPQEPIELIFDIVQLSKDIARHTKIEEKILVPYIEFLERKML